MTTRLDPDRSGFLARPEVRAVVDALAAAWPADKPGPAARFVGGCVRNALIGRPVDDVDVATPLVPRDVVAALEKGGVRAVPTGLEHGTVTAVVDGYPVEVTTLRRDVETDGRRAVVAYTEDWEEDSARRDFRLNAVYADPDGTLYDPQGGIADALAGRIVFIGDAETRIREDYLRILRFFRFRAWIGRGEPDATALAACARLAGGLSGLSAERVWKELKKLLSASDPTTALREMAEAGVLGSEAVLPEAAALDLIEALVALERREGWAPDPMLRLEALVPRMELIAARVRKRLKLSNAEGDRLAAWAGLAASPRDLVGKDEAALGPALYPLDRQAVLDRARLAWALDAARAARREAGEADDADLDPVTDEAWRPLTEVVETWSRPRFPVTGEDVLAAGVAKGPSVGAALKALEALWVRGGFRASREQLLGALSHLKR